MPRERLRRWLYQGGRLPFRGSCRGGSRRGRRRGSREAEEELQQGRGGFPDDAELGGGQPAGGPLRGVPGDAAGHAGGLGRSNSRKISGKALAAVWEILEACIRRSEGVGSQGRLAEVEGAGGGNEDSVGAGGWGGVSGVETGSMGVEAGEILGEAEEFESPGWSPL